MIYPVHNKKILLGSKSPRRKELLEKMGINFEVVTIDCQEVFPDDIPIDKVASYLSNLKANSYQILSENDLLITADTVVAVEGEILGKPTDTEEATKMLRKLSGKKHLVYTSITVKTTEKTNTFTDTAAVHFEEISDEEIAFYLSTQNPFDKAGSYGIQDWIGLTKISKLEGSYYTIMGLPTHILYEVIGNL